MISTITPTSTSGLTHLARLMPSLSQEKVEIVIVDNASKDGTCNYLSQYDCIIKVNKVNQSFSKSNNQGASIATGDYYVFLNNDTVVYPGFADRMLETFSIDPKIGIVGCGIYTMDLPKRIQHAGIMFTPEYVAYELGLEVPGYAPAIQLSDPRVTMTREVPAVTACCMMVKKEVFWELGGFDEKYRFGWEDTDLCLRAREAGYKIWYNGQAMVSHKHFGSAAIGRFKFEKENRALYDQTWVHTGRAKAVLGEFRNG